MKILILGGNGFLGSHLIDSLLGLGHELISLDVSAERFRSNIPVVNYIEADFGNRGILEEVFKKGVDIVFHLASTTLPASSNSDPIFDIQTNLIESVALLDLCVKYPVKKFIFISSGGTVYGDTNTLTSISEDCGQNPLCSYGIVKSAVEKYLYLYRHLYGLNYVALRLSNPYGPRQSPHRKLGAVSTFLYQALTNQTIEIWGDGNVIRDFLFVSDFSRACISSINSDFNGVINIGSGEGITLNELLREIEVVVNKPLLVCYSDARSVDVPRLVLDRSLAFKSLNWRPEISIKEGLVLTESWLQSYIRSE